MMATINDINAPQLGAEDLDRAFFLLAEKLQEGGAPELGLVLCGGSALIITGAVQRVTKDADVVALIADDALVSPDPLPEELRLSTSEVAEDLGLRPDWLNNGPSRGVGGLFQMGLPDGFRDRLVTRRYGPRLAIYFSGRVDQIHFKLYAAADRGGYHVDDLLALAPTAEEIESAARWAMTHDVSEEFAGIVRQMLKEIGYGGVAERL